ncbi:hypothetical protein MTO96_016088 [Rhipicephalus appendiculatus]
MGRSFVAIDNICSEPMKPFDSPRKPSRTLWKTVLTLVLLFQASWHHRIRKATGVARLKIQLLLPKQLKGTRRQGNKVLRQTQMLSQASLAFVAAPGQEGSRIGPNYVYIDHLERVLWSSARSDRHLIRATLV